VKVETGPLLYNAKQNKKKLTVRYKISKL